MLLKYIYYLLMIYCSSSGSSLLPWHCLPYYHHRLRHLKRMATHRMVHNIRECYRQRRRRSTSDVVGISLISKPVKQFSASSSYVRTFKTSCVEGNSFIPGVDTILVTLKQSAEVTAELSHLVGRAHIRSLSLDLRVKHVDKNEWV